jgi:glucose/arabinose dehydrogenase
LAIASCGESGGCSNCGTGATGGAGGGSAGGTSGSGGSSGQGGNSGTVSGLEVTPVISGLDHPWDIAWLPNGIMLVTERPGKLNIYGNGIDQEPSLVIEPDDLVASGEGGMLGLEVDPDFENNGYIYVCLCSNVGGDNPQYVPDVRLVRYELSRPNGDRVINDTPTPIVTDMPYSSGRHSGCRPRFGPDGYLWVGTGDAAIGTLPTTPQDDGSLGGKVLRIDRDGNAHPDNAGGRLWFSKGHRNIQGMAFRTADGLGMSAEHGPSIDDEINLLVAGNFGWDPGSGYNENVPMTDTNKFPDAIEAAWSTGSPTLALSGATFIEGDRWGNWDGVLAVAALRDEHLHIFFVDDEGNVTDGGEYIRGRNRLRTPRMGPDGLLYVTEDVRGGPSDVLQVSPVLMPDAN